MKDRKHDWMPPPQVVVFIVLVSLITVCCVVTTYVWNPCELAMHDRTEMYRAADAWASSQQGTNDRTALNERLNNVFGKRIEQYQKNLESEYSNLWYQVVCIAIAM